MSSDIISAGFVSISFSFSPTVNRLFQLGSFDAYDVDVQIQETVSITNYGGASSTVALAPATDCTDSTARMNISITTAPCTGSTTPIERTGDDAMFITSYSYSKEPESQGQESWSLQSKPTLEGFTGNRSYIQGFAEGNHVTGDDVVSDDGIILTGSVTATTYDATGRNIEVSAGSPSIGSDITQVYGQITRIGGAVGKEDGKRGTSTANIPHELVYY